MTPTPPLAPPLAEFVIGAHQLAISHKTQNLAEGNPDMPFVVSAFRGSAYVASMFATDRDEMLWCLSIAFGGFGADRVSATLDAYSVTGAVPEPGAELGSPQERLARARTNPDTGKDFEPGDMARAFALGRSWVSEHLTTFGLDKASGEILGVASDYKVTGTEVEFAEMAGPQGAEGMEGIVPRAMLRALGTPDIAVEIEQQAAKDGFDFDLTEKQKRAHCDAVLIRVVAAANISMIYGTDDPEIKDIVEESMERARGE